MSSLGRIRKNAENYTINKMYQTMTPLDYQNGIQIAVQRTKNDLLKEFEQQYEKLKQEYNLRIMEHFKLAIDTISIELLYELANQMSYWKLKDNNEDDRYIKESAKIRIQEIYDNTMASINKYADMEIEGQASKQFEKKKKKIEREFKIKL